MRVSMNLMYIISSLISAVLQLRIIANRCKTANENNELSVPRLDHTFHFYYKVPYHELI